MKPRHLTAKAAVTAAALAAGMLLLPGCADREAARFNPLNPERLRHPQEWERARREFLASRRGDVSASRKRTAAPEGREKTPEKPGGDAGAAKPPVLKLSVRQAVEYALRHNHDLLSAAQEKVKARGRITAARAGALPSLSLSASYLRQDEVPSIEVSPGNFLQMGELDNYRAGVSLNQVLYAGGKVRGALRIARDYGEMTEANYRAAELGTRMRVVSAYYSLVLAGKKVEAMEERLRSARAHLSDSETLYRQGAALKLHVMRARSALSLAESALIAARNERETARRDFLLAIGAPLDSEVELTSAIPEPPEDEDVSAPPLSPLAEIRPEIAALQAQIAMQRNNIAVVRGDLKPSLAAFAEYTWENPSSKSLGASGWDDAWQAGLRLSWNIFDGGAVRGRLIEERAALRQLEERLRAAVHAARKEILDAADGVRASEALLKARRNALTEAAEALELARAAYKHGAATQLELLDAQAAYTNARVAYAEALHASAVARAAFRVATGRSPLPERRN